MKRSASAPSSLTSLPRAPRDDAHARVRNYVITMSIRVVCFLLMVLITPYGWYTWAFGLAAAVLPYIAVVFANAGSDSRRPGVEDPSLAITAAPEAPATPERSAPSVITIQERRAPASDLRRPTDPEQPA